MNDTDPERERVSSLRRSRRARHGLVLGAVAGSVGIAGALGLSAAVTQGATTPNTTSITPSTRAEADDGSGQAQRYLVPGDDDGEHEADDDGGQVWVPAPPTTQFNGGQTGNGGGAVAPHATSGGS